MKSELTLKEKSNFQQELFKALDSYGCSYTAFIGVNSEMQYAFNSPNATIVSNDIDLRDVYEDGIPSNMVVSNDWMDSGYNTAKFPVRIVTFK